MGDKEQSGMLRTVIVVGLVAIVSMVIIFGISSLKTSSHNVSTGVLNESKRAQILVNVITDDDATSKYTYTFNDDGTATLTGLKSSSDTLPYQMVIPSYVMSNDKKYVVTKIGNKAFYSKYVKVVGIPDTVTTVGVSAFEYSGISDLILGSHVRVIDDYAFASNLIQSVVLSDDLQKIGQYAFKSNSISDVQIPSGVDAISNHAFWQNNITSVTIPSHTNVDDTAFDPSVAVVKK